MVEEEVGWVILLLVVLVLSFAFTKVTARREREGNLIRFQKKSRWDE